MNKLTLDKAIIIAKESSEDQCMGNRGREEYKQLAAWLKELKQYKNKECEISAREMFEKLGYECYECESTIQYLENNEIVSKSKEITFLLLSHSFYAQHYFNPLNVTVDEFKAIQQQMKELGWI